MVVRRLHATSQQIANCELVQSSGVRRLRAQPTGGITVLNVTKNMIRSQAESYTPRVTVLDALACKEPGVTPMMYAQERRRTAVNSIQSLVSGLKYDMKAAYIRSKKSVLFTMTARRCFLPRLNISTHGSPRTACKR